MAISKKSFVNLDLQGNALVNPTIGLNSNMTKGGSFQYNDAELRLEYFNGSLVEQVANLSDISAVTGGLILQGAYDAANNNPNITDGSALKGYFWVVNVAGTFLGETVQVGDSIIAKVDEAGALLTDWLILQGNVVIATTEVAGITYLATQEQVNGGTETGAYAVTPATLQGKLDPINTDITNLENDKLARDGSQAMTGSLDMGGNNITNAGSIVSTMDVVAHAIAGSEPNGLLLNTNLNADDSATIINLPAPTNGGDATNKTYVDDQDALKLSLTGGTMSGAIDMAGNNIDGAQEVHSQNMFANALLVNQISTNGFNNEVLVTSPLNFNNVNSIINLPAPTDDGDATNRLYVDGAIDSLSYAVYIDSVDWTLNAGVYEYTITHNLGFNVTYTAFYGGENVDFGAVFAPNTLTLYSNINPSADTNVTIYAKI